MPGWIKLHRKITESWMWKKKPFSDGQAWMDLVLMANHKDAKIMFDGKVMEIKRGSFMTSKERLKKRWGWARKRFDTFLRNGTREGTVWAQNSAYRGTYITICNYDTYNDVEQAKEQARDKPGTSQDTINKNEKNEKKYIAPRNKEKLSLLWQAMIATFGIKETDRTLLGKLSRDFYDKGASPESVKRYCEVYRKRYPDMTFSPHAVLKNWYSLIKASPIIQERKYVTMTPTVTPEQM